jgi:phosphoglycerate dehydrogenase-like enzyme
MADAAFLGRMKDGALLVNAARGSVVTEALCAELRAGRLHAALGVADPEPLPADHPLWAAPNVLIAPHVAASTPRPPCGQVRSSVTRLSGICAERPCAT